MIVIRTMTKSGSRVSLVGMALLLALLTGCATVPSADVQTFSLGIATAKSQADTAFQGVADVTSSSIIEFAAAQKTLSDTNFQPVLDPKSVLLWDDVFDALKAYGQSLTTLTATGNTKSYEDAAVGLSTQLKRAGTNLAIEDVTLKKGLTSPSLAAAFTDLGDFLLRAKANRDVKKILVESDPTIHLIFVTMAEAVGLSQTNGLRSTVHEHWEEQKADQKLNFLTVKTNERQAVASKYATLLKNEIAQDAALAALSTSLMALADAHHALANHDSAGVKADVSIVELELQRTFDLSRRFQPSKKSSDD